MSKKNNYDVIILGAGASGLFCGSIAGKRGKKVLILERNRAIGRKIFISGGGRCNFTNLSVDRQHFLCQNPHFLKGVFREYNSDNFINLVRQYNINFYEKKMGQLFCKESSAQIINMLEKECLLHSVEIKTQQDVLKVQQIGTDYRILCQKEEFNASKLVIASGGLSFPKIGATDIGYQLAKQFGHTIIETAPALVGLRFPEGKDKKICEKLSGVSLPVRITHKKSKACFDDDLLFTHHGLSGPAVLKISLYWNHGEELTINLLPGERPDIFDNLPRKQKISSVLKKYFPKKFVEEAFIYLNIEDKYFAEMGKKDRERLKNFIFNFSIIPQATEGYRRAEVTKGGICTKEVNNKTMESKIVENLYFVGEVLDVTGWLGGYNFQWAWTSGFIAGHAI